MIHGTIYCIQAASGPMKVGYVRGSLVERRLKSLQGATHEALTLVNTRAGNQREERALHAKYASDRIRGEWFNPSDILLAEFDGSRA